MEACWSPWFIQATTFQDGLFVDSATKFASAVFYKRISLPLGAYKQTHPSIAKYCLNAATGFFVFWGMWRPLVHVETLGTIFHESSVRLRKRHIWG